MARIVRRDVIPEKRSDDPIVCKICLACYDGGPRVPLVLNCRHTFCAPCIADSLMHPDDRTRIVCPLCKTRTTLGRKGLAGLPVNETSLEMIRTLEQRKRLELMQRDGIPRPGLEPDRPPYADGPSLQIAHPLRSERPAAQPGQPKGILKIRPKQTRFSREEFSAVEQNKVPDGSSSAVDNGSGIIPETHTVVVKSAQRLHPPPQLSSLDPALPSNGEVRTENPGGRDGLDVDEVAVEFPEGGHPVSDQNDQSMFLNSVPPDFLKSRTDSADPSFVIPDTTRDPFRIDNATGTGEDPDTRIYPVNALMYMASAEGIPLDQLTSVDQRMTSDLAVSSSSSSLTESQRRLPSNAKYVGRFGNYSERRQPGSFQGPRRITCSSNGTRLAISDPQGHGVHVYSSKGEFVSFFGVPNVSNGLGFLGDDHLAVATATGVQVHLINGTLKKTIPIAGVLAVAPLKQGFVAASRNRISVCRSLVGSVIHSLNGKRDPQLNRKLIPFDEIVDLAVSPKDELCILEAKFVVIADDEGVVVTVIRPDETSPCGPIGRGIALASCPEDGSVVVVDGGHGRVLLFGPDGGFSQGLLSLGQGPAAGGDVTGVVVTKSRRMYAVLSGEKTAEVRVYTF